MDLSVITVTYQSKEHIEECILSLFPHTLHCTYEHIIVDNGSTDGTVELIENYYSSYVTLIKNGENRGFAAANNQALEQAQGRYILFLNPDMQLHEGFLDTLLEKLEKRPDVGLISCKLLSQAHEPHHVLRPMKFPTLLPYLPSFLKLRPFFCSIHPKFFYPDFKDDLEQEVEVVRGAFMLLHRETLQRLRFAFDPRYFLLFEDLDLCQEICRLGLKVLYSPAVSCIDYFGHSFLSHTMAWKYLHMVRSFKIYVKKWHSRVHLLWIHLVTPLGFLLRIPEWGLREAWQALTSKLHE